MWKIPDQIKENSNISQTEDYANPNSDSRSIDRPPTMGQEQWQGTVNRAMRKTDYSPAGVELIFFKKKVLFKKHTPSLKYDYDIG